MADFRIKQGYTVPILGEPARNLSEAPNSPFLGVCPVAFPGLKPRLDVSIDTEVKVGTRLFHDKKNSDVCFLSPAAGRVTAINYGPRRVIEEIIIATNGGNQSETFSKHDLAEIASMQRDTLLAELHEGGVWPFIRQRPFNKIADGKQNPKSIFVNCMDSAPLANDPNFSLKEKASAFKAGVAAMRVLCDRVHLAMNPDAADVFKGLDGVSSHTFTGKHPAGLTGTHIGLIDPINKGDVVWTVNARDVVLIGELLLVGSYPTERIVALAGPGLKEPGYYRTRLGARINDLVAGKTGEGEQRYISGNVLSGQQKNQQSFLGFYDDLITVLPEGREQHFIGWMLPGADRPSYSRTFLSTFLGGKRFNMNTNLNGGRRTIIQSGIWGEVTGLDIYPEFLVKACLAEDIDAMERLGILECDPEDFALCTYICPSKTEVSQIIAEGLELMEREG